MSEDPRPQRRNDKDWRHGLVFTVVAAAVLAALYYGFLYACWMTGSCP